MSQTDPVSLTRDLIRCPSVTPAEGGAITLLSDLLSAHGFECHRPDRAGIANLYARFGPKGAARTFAFNGHTDVVPPGDAALWQHPPFEAAVADGQVWGRGACDMKSAVAAFAVAAIGAVKELPEDAAIVLAITGDEEGDGVDGTTAILHWMEAAGEVWSVCLVGEPTCPEALGDMMKIGRRGSMTAYITAEGVQGHVAYPHRARNPMHAMVRLLDGLASRELDAGTDHFDPSSLQITTVDTGNPANNVIPAACRATLNIRFNDAHSSKSLGQWIEAEAASVADETGVKMTVLLKVSGESFMTPPGPLSDLVAAAVEAETGRRPELSTSGGTSDARFIRSHCPVVEFGLTGQTMHKVDERVSVAEIEALSRIYSRILADYFA